MIKILSVSIILFSFSIQNSFAYLDPGTGSIILHALLAAIAACITWIVAKYRKIKSFFKQKINNKDTHFDKN
tara:strand:+ start:68 stop:283 length:216 start_codon:yes stop_codon:yes gene_type:complete